MRSCYWLLLVRKKNFNGEFKLEPATTYHKKFAMKNIMNVAFLIKIK